jgi:hypothetical protein
MVGGFTNAFSTLLMTGANYGMSQMKYPSSNPYFSGRLDSYSLRAGRI